MDNRERLAGQKKEIQFIVWLRAISVILILLCHITQTHDNPYVVMTSQIFNVGVNIFVIISGFLFGLFGVRKPYLRWYGKRIKRIFIPYWVFLFGVAVVTLAAQRGFNWFNWMMNIFGLHGFSYFIKGVEHTWFITAILLCYLATPLIEMLTQKVPRNRHGLLCLVLLVVPVVLIKTFNYAIYLAVFFFAVAYIVGRHWADFRITGKKAALAFAAVIGSFLLRFACKMIFDGTICYNYFVVPCTHYAAAFGLLVGFAWLFERKPWKIVRIINDMSFEIYLWHYLFLWPPLSTMQLTPWWGVNVVLAMLATAVVSCITHRLAGLIEKLFIRKEA